jgi:hypothetical protein
MYSQKQMIAPQFISATTGILYTSPASVQSKITQMSVTNTDSSAQTFSLYITPGIAAPAAYEAVIKSKVLAPNETWICYPLYSAIIKAGSSIQAVASIADKIVITASCIDIA